MGLNNDMPVFNNGIKANMADMKKFFNGNVSKENAAKLASIFAKCDTEGKVDKNGKQVADGELKGEERNKFMDMVQKFLPEAVMDVAEFFIAVEMSEDREKTRQETYNSAKSLQKEERQNKAKNDIKFGLD